MQFRFWRSKWLQRALFLPLLVFGMSSQSVNSAENVLDVKSIVATVNDEVITSYDIDQRLRLAMMSSKGSIPEELLVQIRGQILRNLVDEKLRIQETERLEVETSKEEIVAEVESVARQNGMTYEQFVKTLSNAGVALSTIEHQLKADVSWAKLVRGRYGRSVIISENDLEYAFQQALSNTNQTSYDLLEIFLGVPSPDKERDVYNDIMQLRRQIERGTPLADIAKQFSQSISAAANGELGWVTANDVDPEIAKELTSLAPGQISRPIRTQEGYTLIAIRQRVIPGKGDPLQSTIKLRQLFFGFTEQPTQESFEKMMTTAGDAKSKLKGCSNLSQVAEQHENAVAVDVETFKIKDLPPAIQQTVLNLQGGQSANPLPSDRGVHIFVVCSRTDVKTQVREPTREDVENRLYTQQLSMYAKRYIRDLRADATIDYRNY